MPAFKLILAGFTCLCIYFGRILKVTVALTFDAFLTSCVDLQPGSPKLLLLGFHAYPALMLMRPALQGMDTRNNGHFTYASQPDFEGLQPFTCTNRAEVVSILASIGACRPVKKHPNIPRIPSSILGEPIPSKRNQGRPRVIVQDSAAESALPSGQTSAHGDSQACRSVSSDLNSQGQSRANTGTSSRSEGHGQATVSRIERRNARTQPHPEAAELSFGSQRFNPDPAECLRMPGLVSYR